MSPLIVTLIEKEVAVVNVIERRERIIRILMLNGKRTVKELSDELGVSVRTIMRDIDTLSTSKPIYTVSGRNGGVYLLDTYDANRVYFKEEEMSVISKIISESENHKTYILSELDTELLKEMLVFYSRPKYERGKRI